MTTLQMWIAQLRGFFRKAQLDRELDEELASHLEMHVADNVRAGMTPDQARRDALIKLGGVEQTKEDYRDTRGIGWLENILQDLRFGLRMLRKSPGFTTVAMLTLALGIGANTAIFTVVNSVLIRSLPFPRASELIDISARSTSFDIPSLGFSVADVEDIRAGSSSFAGIATYRDAPKEVTGKGKPERITGTEVSEDFFPLLGIHPAYGRTFTQYDMQPGTHVAVLSYALWQERFGGDPSAIGKTITLDAQPHTIIGVMPAQRPLGFATDSQVWTPFIPTDEERTAREGSACWAIARLKPGVTLGQVQGELDTISARLASAYPEAHKGWSVYGRSLKQSLFGDANTPLAILFCAVGFVLLIACANVSNLFLSRGWARRREFAIRSAIGATRGALLRQLAVECVLVALAGGVCAFFIATWTLGGLRSILPPEIPRTQDIRIDSGVAWFTLGASLFAALLSGLAPALLSTRQNVSVAIKESIGGSGSNGSHARHNALRQLLVIGEVALAAILLIGATLAMRSFDRLLRQNLGFQPNHVVTLQIEFPKFRLANEQQAIAFVQQVLDGTRGIAGVTSASAGLVFPMSDEIAETTFETEATAADANLGEQPALGNRVAPDFFRSMGIPLLAGRDFTDADARGNSPVFIVNEALSRKYFGSLDIIGKRFSTRRESGHPAWGEIVGVVGNVREATPYAEPKPQIYAPFYQTRIATGVYLIVRTKADPLAIVPALQDRIWAVDKNQPIIAIKTVEAQIAEVNATNGAQGILLSIFSALGFILALVGVYGVMSYLVSLQTREIGIRMALGADRGQLLRSVIVHGLKLTLSGVMIGVISGLALTRFMSSILFGIRATDPLTFAAVAAVLTIVALAACYVPAKRATRVDPMIALRYE
jgi:predicted permease